MNQAVIETGGKQYLVSPNEKVTIEKLTAGVDEVVTFDRVLLTSDDAKTVVGKPFIPGAKVTAKVLSQEKGDKIVVFKYRNKSRYRRKQGHRQLLTVVRIESIA